MSDDGGRGVWFWVRGSNYWVWRRGRGKRSMGEWGLARRYRICWVQQVGALEDGLLQGGKTRDRSLGDGFMFIVYVVFMCKSGRIELRVLDSKGLTREGVFRVIYWTMKEM